MTRYEEPMLKCDGNEGFCDLTERDYYAQYASAVNGIAITETRRAPHWLSTGDEDYCPEHIPEEV